MKRATNTDKIKGKKNRISLRSQKWKKKRVVRSIIHLAKNKRSLSPWHMQKGPEADLTRKCLTELEGCHVSAYMLYRNAIRTFGSWDRALGACGLKPHLIRKCAPPIRRRPDKVKQLILFLHNKKVSLNYKYLDKNSSEIRRLLFEGGFTVTTGRSIIRAAERNFGSWRNALKQCGLDPELFYLKRRRTSNLSIMPHQTEWVEDKSGRRYKQLLYGESIATPEELLSKRQTQVKTNEIFANLKTSEGDIFFDILKAIEHLEPNDFNNADINQVLSRMLSHKYKCECIDAALVNLQQNKALKDLLKDMIAS